MFTGGFFEFSFTNTPGVSFTVLSTTNLTLPPNQWQVVGGVAEVVRGQYLFIDYLDPLGPTSVLSRSFAVTSDFKSRRKGLPSTPPFIALKRLASIVAVMASILPAGALTFNITYDPGLTN